MSNSVMPTYARMNVCFTHGEGPYLWDQNGTRYLDALSGIAVCGLGHAHPKVTEAVAQQAGRLVHTSNLYRIELQERLAERLCEMSGLDNVFFCNSGAEANEAALKIARRAGNDRGYQCPTVLVANGSFHGRTLGTLSATGNPKVHAGFDPLVAGFHHVPYSDLDALGEALNANGEICAVFVEPVQGEGGVVVPDPGFLTAVRTFCEDHDLILILDEVQTGMGRTGEWFAWQHDGARPDVMTLAKALGNGVPIGACLAGSQAQTLHPGSHGSTFGGNPLACAAALAVIDTIESDGLRQRASALGERMRAGFASALAGVDCVADIRGSGLMVGVELDQACGELVGAALEHGLLINVAAERTVRLLPPLILSDAQADQIVTICSDLIRAL
ncbi:MAG: acetylornithine transaminase [Pseudomonadota bacterium]